MKRAERINQELLFLHGKKSFNLSDLMDEFSISKSTALRDIQELENLGVPLYVENGRYGGYKIVQHSLLPPIYFKEKEVFTIFFALQLLKLTLNSPFGNTYEHIKQKLLKTFREDRQLTISKVSEIVQYEGISQLTITQNLEEIFSSILNGNALTIHYTRYKKDEKYIFPIRLVIMDGYWYCVGLDLNKSKWRTYRCEYMEILEIDKNFHISLTGEQIKKSYHVQNQRDRTIPFQVKLSPAGKELYLKRHYANMELSERDGQLFVIGKTNKQEINFLANYFLSFGEAVTILEPEILKDEYVRIIKSLLDKHT